MNAEQPQTQVNVTPPPTLPAGGVMITPKEMYDDILAIKLAVVGLPPRVDKLESEVVQLQTALDAVKGKVFMMAGGAGVLGVVAGMVFPLLAK